MLSWIKDGVPKMRFSPAFLDEIRARVPVSDVVRLKVALKKQGREWRGLSPFNSEKTPSFYVNDQKGFFHDFSSAKHGDGFDFLMETEGLSFPEAVERLAQMAGLPLPLESREQRESDQRRASLHEILEEAARYFEKSLAGAAGREARDYLAGRGVSSQSRALFRLGFAPGDRHGLRDHLAAKGAAVDDMILAGLLVHGDDIPVPYDRFRNRVMFPICDRMGKVIAFGGRAMEAGAKAKYLNSPETPLFKKGATLYNLHNARREAHDLGVIYVVEGYLDVVALTAAGIAQATAPLGTALTPEQLALLWRHTEEPALCFDGDAAGLRAAWRVLDTALPLLTPQRRLRFVVLPSGQDPDDLYRAGGAAALVEALRATTSFVDLLWMRETQERSFDTPESRAGLEHRLRQLVEQIADQSLRRHYLDELRGRCRALFGASSRGGADARPSAPRTRFRDSERRGFDSRNRGAQAPRVSAALAASPLMKGVKAAISPREAVILLTLLNHPELIASHLDEIAALDFVSSETRALTAALLEFGLSADGDLDRFLSERGLDALREKLNARAAHSAIWSVKSSASAADAERSLRQALSLHRKSGALNKELLEVTARLASAPSDQDIARLGLLQGQLSEIDGLEAFVDGFGEGSGRLSKVF